MILTSRRSVNDICASGLAHSDDITSRGRDERNRHVPAPDLPVARLLQESYPFKSAGIREIQSIEMRRSTSGTDRHESPAAPDGSWVWA
jgi:hypothetical protein